MKIIFLAIVFIFINGLKRLMPINSIVKRNERQMCSGNREAILPLEEIRNYY